MGITKMGSDDNSKEKLTRSIESYFNENKFKEMFSRATELKNTSQDSGKELKSFYNLVTTEQLERIINESSIDSFLEELNNFLHNPTFLDNEKRSFMNECENTCLIQALHANKFHIAENVNKFRRQKSAYKCELFTADRIKAEEYELLDKFLSLSTAITYDNSGLLRLVYNYGCRDYDYIDKLITEYGLDINGFGDTYGLSYQTTFAQLVCIKSGTKGFEFFQKFMQNYGNKIDFDIQYVYVKTSNNVVRRNILEELFLGKFDTPETLNRLKVILDNCDLSVKHIAYICQYLFSDKNSYITNHYDHPVYESLFAHESFNSNLFDREAILNKLIENDKRQPFMKIRANSNNTINPTSILLDKFFNFAIRPIPKNTHPFVTWVEGQKTVFCIDTLKSLAHHYSEEMNSLDLHKKVNCFDLKKALQENGLVIPERGGFISFLLGRKVPSPVVAANAPQMKTVTETPIKVIQKAVFNEGIFEQVKDEHIKKLIDSVKLNYEQYHAMTKKDELTEDTHYMTNLLPKFLNSTVENYLHFATIDESEASNNTLIQLKMLNRKTFAVLSAELEKDHQELSQQTRVQGKVMQKYN